ncbi:MAG: Integral membrane sensor hybrid histidine kinase, partial [uncultured Thiotrichaceae bacterium]
MFNPHHLYRLLFLLCWLPTSLHALAPTLIVTDDTSYYELKLNTDMLEDPTGELTFEDVTSGLHDFYALPADIEKGQPLDMGFTQSAFWFRVQMINQSTEKNFYFGHWGGLSRQIQVYIVSEDDTEPFTKLKLIYKPRSMQYRFTFPHGASRILYFRVQDKHAPLTISPELMNAPSIMGRIKSDYPVFSLIVGGLLTLVLYNFFYFIYLRDRGFLALSFLILAFVLEFGNHLGLLHYYSFLRESLQSVGALFAFVTIASGLSLFSRWLNIQQHLPQYEKWLHVAFWISCALAIISPFILYSVAIAGIWSGVILFLIGWVIFSYIRKGLYLPSSLRISGGIFVIGMIPALLRTLGLIEEGPWIGEIALFTLLISLVLLSLMQAEQVRYKSEQAERITAA